jgi:hypothetical protein
MEAVWKSPDEDPPRLWGDDDGVAWRSVEVLAVDGFGLFDKLYLSVNHCGNRDWCNPRYGPVEPPEAWTEFPLPPPHVREKMAASVQTYAERYLAARKPPVSSSPP